MQAELSNWWSPTANQQKGTSAVNEDWVTTATAPKSRAATVPAAAPQEFICFVNVFDTCLVNVQPNIVEQCFWEMNWRALLSQLIVDIRDGELKAKLSDTTKEAAYIFVERLPSMSILPKYSFAGDDTIDFTWGNGVQKRIILGISAGGSYVLERDEIGWKAKDFCHSNPVILADIIAPKIASW